MVSGNHDASLAMEGELAALRGGVAPHAGAPVRARLACANPASPAFYLQDEALAFATPSGARIVVHGCPWGPQVREKKHLGSYRLSIFDSLDSLFNSGCMTPRPAVRSTASSGWTRRPAPASRGGAARRLRPATRGASCLDPGGRRATRRTS